jgi:hypothetical protein
MWGGKTSDLRLAGVDDHFSFSSSLVSGGSNELTRFF